MAITNGLFHQQAIKELVTTNGPADVLTRCHFCILLFLFLNFIKISLILLSNARMLYPSLQLIRCDIQKLSRYVLRNSENTSILGQMTTLLRPI